MKSVTIIRHAKSSWNAAVDFESPLDETGIDDAKIMGDVLANKKNNYDIIIQSSANRAITTAKIIANQIKYKNKIKEEQYIYGASSAKLFNMITTLDDALSSIALVGHNPTLHILSENLSNEKFMLFPPCSIVHISFQINSWDKLQSGNLEYFLFPELCKK